MKLEPLLAVRRYSFVANVRELLRKAEEHFASICEEREAERVRLEREKEQARQQKEVERLRLEREKEAHRQQREREREQTRQQQEAERLRQQREKEADRRRRAEQAEQRRKVAGILLIWSSLGIVLLGGLGALLGGIGLQMMVRVVVGLIVLGVFIALCKLTYDEGKAKGFFSGCATLFLGMIIFNVIASFIKSVLDAIPDVGRGNGVFFGVIGGVLGGIIGAIVGGTVVSKSN